MPWDSLTIAARLLAVYVAAVLQLSLIGDGPQLLLVVVGWILCAAPHREGIAWAAGIGLLMDALSQSRLGLHLAVCGSLSAVVCVTVLAHPRRGILWPPLISGWLAAGDAAISHTLSQVWQGASLDASVITRDAVERGLWTAGVVFACGLLLEVGRRCLRSQSAIRSFELQNQWTRLSEV